MINKEKIKYIVVGGINTIVGYLIGVAIYKLLNKDLNIISIGVISNILSISFSYLTYKNFIFKTKGNWINEYIRAYVIYGGSGLFGIFMLWIFLDIMKISIWTAQALTIITTVIISYFGHKFFTFKIK